MLGVRQRDSVKGWDGTLGFFQDSEFRSLPCQRIFHVMLSLSFKPFSVSILQQLNRIVLFFLAVWVVSSLKQRLFLLMLVYISWRAWSWLYLLLWTFFFFNERMSTCPPLSAQGQPVLPLQVSYHSSCTGSRRQDFDSKLSKCESTARVVPVKV